MKMDEMNAYFESKGFTVEREYHPRDMGQRSYYTFVISKNNNHRRGTYIWPEDQQYFMDHMIKKFEDEFGESTLSINDVMAYANSRCCTVNIERSMCGSTEIEVECGSDTYIRNFDRHVLHGDLIRAIKGMIDEITRPQNEFVKYCENDVKNTMEIYKFMNNNYIQRLTAKIKNVIFNDPATIVFWTDGTKTVVKCQDGDIYDPEKGLAMAISKKALGNKGNYCNELKRWLPKKYLCMYCGAETTNDSWDHMCDECKNEPFDPIPESLKKDICSKIKLPDLSGLQIASMALDNVAKSLKDRRKKSAVQKAYDVLVKSRDDNLDYSTLLHPIEEAIGYLGEALEDEEDVA